MSLVARTQAENRLAAACHHEATLARLAQLGIDIATLRCCILEWRRAGALTSREAGV